MRLLMLLAMTPLSAHAADRPVPVAGQAHRSETVAVNGMVCTSHPLAAQVGLDVLKSGGNAVDAAVAASAAMGLMEPTSCGIGGDLFAIVYDAKTRKLSGLNASGPAPKRATLAYFARSVTPAARRTSSSTKNFPVASGSVLFRVRIA